MKEINFFDVGKIKIGHAHNFDAATGCTVLIFEDCMTAGVDIRGGGPASRETNLLNPMTMAKGINAIIISGGSAFGLDAAGGVMRYLEEKNIGFDVGVTKVPLVCQSCLFDLSIGRADVRPDSDMAYQACLFANSHMNLQGCVGAGVGCTVGKFYGKDYAMKSGIGMYAVQVGKIKVGAIVAVNAFGDIFDIDTGKQIAGLLQEDRINLRSTENEMYKNNKYLIQNSFISNTTIGAVITNGVFSKSEMNKIASMAQNGLARSIRPVHTMLDGDSIYAVSLGNEILDLNTVGTLASYVVAYAVKNSIFSATSLQGYLAYCDLNI